MCQASDEVLVPSTEVRAYNVRGPRTYVLNPNYAFVAAILAPLVACGRH